MLSAPSSFSQFSATARPPLSQASPRVRFPTILAYAATTTAAETSTENTRTNTSSYLNRPHNNTAACTSLYQILGIPTVATFQEIKTAYRRLARTCHPDVATTDSKDSSTGEFMRIHAAYSTLSDPEKRAVYDRKLFPRYQPLTTSSGFSGYTRRNWETDQCW
uniref:J domain-containing protein n=1 Tax=Fagus sylvatica TaxID=28930 RepID=A0A2N9IB16_FAGSY